MTYLTPGTWGASNQLITASWLSQFSPRETEGTIEAEPLWLQTLGGYPSLSETRLTGRTFGIWMLPKVQNNALRREQVTKMFNPDSGSGLLTATDESGASRQLTCRPISVIPHPNHPRGFVVTLAAPNPVWEGVAERSASVVSDVPNNSVTLNVTPSGNEFAEPTITIKATNWSSASNDWRYWQKFTIRNLLDYRLTNYPVLVSACMWDCSSLMAAGSMHQPLYRLYGGWYQLFGDAWSDVRVILNNQLVDAYVFSESTSNLSVWINVNLEANTTASGAIIFGNLAASPIWNSAWGPESVIDKLRLPMIDGYHSNNSHWEYSGYGLGTELGSHPASWRYYYDGPGPGNNDSEWAWVAIHGTYTGVFTGQDPWATIGAVKQRSVGQRAALTNGYVLALPVAASSFQMSIWRRLNGAGSVSRMQVNYRTASQQFTPFNNIWNDYEDTSACVIGGGSYFGKLSTCSIDFWPAPAREILVKVSTPALSGGSTGTPDNYGFYVDSACINFTACVPLVTLAGITQMVHVTASLANAIYSPALKLVLSAFVDVNDTLEINTRNRTVINLTTGCYMNQSLEVPTLRRDWLPLQSGSVNPLTFQDGTASAYDVTVKWRDRWL